MAKRSFDDFDEHAQNYRDVHTANIKWSGADSYYYSAWKVKLMAQYETNAPIRLLDLGCGDGTSELFFSRFFPAFSIEGLDVSQESIDLAGKKRIPKCDFSVYDGHTIPFEDGCFDIVFAAAVFHHIDFSLHQQVLSEIYRVLKPGGRFYLFEHNPLNPVTRYFVKTCAFDKDARLLGHRYSKKLLVAEGFEPVQHRFILFFPRNGIWKKILPLEEKLHWLPLGGQYFLRAVK